MKKMERIYEDGKFKEIKETEIREVFVVRKLKSYEFDIENENRDEDKEVFFKVESLNPKSIHSGEVFRTANEAIENGKKAMEFADEVLFLVKRE